VAGANALLAVPSVAFIPFIMIWFRGLADTAQYAYSNRGASQLARRRDFRTNCWLHHKRAFLLKPNVVA